MTPGLILVVVLLLIAHCRNVKTMTATPKQNPAIETAGAYKTTIVGSAASPQPSNVPIPLALIRRG